MAPVIPNVPEPTGQPGVFRWDVEDGWQTGRGAYGGLVLSAMTRALRHHLGKPELLLRSLTAAVPAPVLVGPTKLSVWVIRAGSNTATLEAELEQDGTICGHAIAIYGAERDPTASWNDVAAPDMRDWRELPVAPVGPPIAPPFTKHLEFRLITPPPFSGHVERRAAGWVRSRYRPDRPDESDLVFLMDSWWAAFLSAMTKPRPVATIAFTMQFLSGWDELDADAPLFYRGSSPAASQGYATDFRELWSENGRLVALNQQTMAIIK